ncbi:MAG: hypothetical protein KKA79_06050 [Nanoarchaeota archaeon]|nr:hypothetical protein [Nanoarchaeota archaeon]
MKICCDLDIVKLPDELKQAVVEKALPLDIAVQLVELNNPFVNEKMVQVINRKKRYEKDILKNALAAVAKSKNMKKKLNILKKATDAGVILSSVWDFGNRDNYAGDANFHGNAPTQVVEQCILRLTSKDDLIVDPMAGSGTTIDVCKAYNRKVRAFDLTPTRKDIVENDSRCIPMDDFSADLVFLHPPYLGMVKYSKKERDVSRLSLDEFLESMRLVIMESKRILKKDKHLCILVGNVVMKGKFISLSRKLSNICEELGLEDCGHAIKITKNSVSQRRRGKAIYAELATTKNLKQNHDIMLFWRK